MGIHYGATYGIGVQLEDDQFNVTDVFMKMNEIEDEDDVDYDDWDECEIISDYLEDLIKDYEFLHVATGGNWNQDWYEYYIFIVDPMNDLAWLPIKIEQLNKFIKSSDLTFDSTEVGLIGGCNVS